MRRTIPTKSGLMVGLGEEWDELVQTLRDLRAVGCQIVTIGQYLRPSLANLPMSRYYTPAEFAELKRIGLELGFGHVESGPLVRISYHAHEQVAVAGRQSADPSDSRVPGHASPHVSSDPRHRRLQPLRASAHVLRTHRARQEGRTSRRHLLGQACPGIWRSAGARARPRPGAGGARRQSHRTGLHRRRLRRLPDARDARGRLRQHPDVSAIGRRIDR